MNIGKFIVTFNRWYQLNHKRFIKVLGIETSCDDTGVGIVNENKEVLGEAINSQTHIHVQAGGILPPIARDLHKQNINGVMQEALLRAKMSVNEVDVICISNRPGLSLSLTVGLDYAKTLARNYNKPLMPIHHMEAHALAVRLTNNVTMPYLTLLISGGHALLAVVRGVEDFYLLGRGLDDAPGEILDKIARRLGLKDHPDCNGVSGGRAVEILAEKFDTPTIERPMPPIMHRWPDCNFSFSGIKSWTMRLIDRLEEKEENPTDILKNAHIVCHLAQDAILRHVAKRIQRALIYCELKELLPKSGRTLVISGGVGSNLYLRKGLAKVCNHYDCKIIAPPIKYCTDNGVMVAWNGMERVLAGGKGTFDYDDIVIQPKCPLGTDLTADVLDSNIKLPYLKLTA